MKKIQQGENAIVLRTDYSNQEVWEAVRTAMLAPSPDDGFQAYVDIVEDPAYQDMTIKEVLQHVDSPIGFLFIVDNMTIVHPDHPILCIDLLDEPGQSFRLVPTELWAVENNLSIANMDYFEFRDAVDADGIFRGFQ